MNITQEGEEIIKGVEHQLYIIKEQLEYLNKIKEKLENEYTNRTSTVTGNKDLD